MIEKAVPLAIITPAFNEEAYLEKTISSVLEQSAKPLVWVIVDDGSTDQTPNIIKRYEDQYDFIKFLQRERVNGQAYYASNVYAIRKGHEYLESTGLGYDYLAILDADIELPKEYYETILALFQKNPELGIASGHCLDRCGEDLKAGLYDWRAVPKGIMVLRKQCYEDIDGFVPLKHSGEDTCACCLARMKGWKTWATTNVMAIHYRPLGATVSKNRMQFRFQQGISEYYMGSHPLFMLIKSGRRAFKEAPFLVGGVARLFGFVYAYFQAQDRQIPSELISFIRKEQMQRVLSGNKPERGYIDEY